MLRLLSTIKTRVMNRPLLAAMALVVAASFLVGAEVPSSAIPPIDHHVMVQRDGTTYVSTGDIQADWLRDSSAIARPYIDRARSDPEAARALRGIIARQAKYILIDPYANAFSSDYKVFERKFEIDSLLYPIWFAYEYWKGTGDGSIFNGKTSLAFDRVLQVMRDEQHHGTRSRYRHPQLANNGKGSEIAYTGMVWTGFRPSDDPVRYHYNIPENMLAVVVLQYLTKIERDIYHDQHKAANAWGLSVQIQRGIERYGRTDVDGFGTIYAYEVDGRGHSNLMDDANVPSLLSIPYIGYRPVGNPIYQNTRRFALSPRNPYFYTGKHAEGIGSPHTPKGYVWPLALVMQALTSTDETETQRVMQYIVASTSSDRRLHESFDPDDPTAFTREDFAWPNALYAEFVAARQ